MMAERNKASKAGDQATANAANKIPKVSNTMLVMNGHFTPGRKKDISQILWTKKE